MLKPNRRCFPHALLANASALTAALALFWSAAAAAAE
jgi:hypothetical protein